MIRQAKDIPTDAFVDAVLAIGLLRESRMTVRWEVQEDLARRLGWDGQGGWEGIEQYLPAKVLTAKAKRLIRRGILDGCWCGCRGDYEVTPEVAAARGFTPSPDDRGGSQHPYGYWMRDQAGAR